MPSGDMTSLILASGSSTRRKMLAAAGVVVHVVSADVDEAAIRDTLTAGGNDMDPLDIAEVLARAKAQQVSAAHPNALVIGADQILALGARLFAKPDDLEGARQTLRDLRGHTHQLHSAVVLAQDGEVIWSHGDTAHLAVRDVSDAFIERYLREVGPDVCQSVGAYQLEGLGVQLFDRIEGDYFTILGLPLLPLLAELRARGVIQT
jgi:septum formation protein